MRSGNIGFMKEQESRFNSYMATRAEMTQLSRRLVYTFKTLQAISEWMKSENLSLKGATPLDKIRQRDVSSVDGLLEAIDSGIFL